MNNLALAFYCKFYLTCTCISLIITMNSVSFLFVFLCLSRNLNSYLHLSLFSGGFTQSFFCRWKTWHNPLRYNWPVYEAKSSCSHSCKLCFVKWIQTLKLRGSIPSTVANFASACKYLCFKNCFVFNFLFVLSLKNECFAIVTKFHNLNFRCFLLPSNFLKNEVLRHFSKEQLL